VYGADVDSFGAHVSGASNRILSEILV
jgi:hypothetical protein